MSALMLAAIAAITYGSRTVSLVFLPRPGARFEALLARMPAPIFAGLATATLLTSDRSLAARSSGPPWARCWSAPPARSCSA